MSLLKDRRVWIGAGLVAALGGLYWAGVGDALTLDSLARHRAALVGFVEGNRVAAAAAYVGLYAAAVGVSLPGAGFLTIAGGFLFGPWLGTALAVTGATLGAAIVFVLARRLFGADALDRLGPTAQRLGEAIRRNAASYLLVLRLVPLFPFFLVNLVPAFVGVRLPVQVATTALGILPGSAVYALAGAGLGRTLDAGGAPSLGDVLTPEVIAALLGLAALSLAAIPLRRRFAKG